MVRPLLMYLLVVTTPALALAVERSEMAVIDASRVALPVVQPLNGGHPPTALPSFPSSTYPYFAEDRDDRRQSSAKNGVIS